MVKFMKLSTIELIYIWFYLILKKLTHFFLGLFYFDFGYCFRLLTHFWLFLFLDYWFLFFRFYNFKNILNSRFFFLDVFRIYLDNKLVIFLLMFLGFGWIIYVWLNYINWSYNQIVVTFRSLECTFVSQVDYTSRRSTFYIVDRIPHLFCN